jgi:hypothetical protein
MKDVRSTLTMRGRVGGRMQVVGHVFGVGGIGARESHGCPHSSEADFQ